MTTLTAPAPLADLSISEQFVSVVSVTNPDDPCDFYDHERVFNLDFKPVIHDDGSAGLDVYIDGELQDICFFDGCNTVEDHRQAAQSLCHDSHADQIFSPAEW